MFGKILDFLSKLATKEFIVSVIAIVVIVVVYMIVVSCGALSVKEFDWKYKGTEVPLQEEVYGYK